MYWSLLQSLLPCIVNGVSNNYWKLFAFFRCHHLLWYMQIWSWLCEYDFKNCCTAARAFRWIPVQCVQSGVENLTKVHVCHSFLSKSKAWNYIWDYTCLTFPTEFVVCEMPNSNKINWRQIIQTGENWKGVWKFWLCLHFTVLRAYDSDTSTPQPVLVCVRTGTGSQFHVINFTDSSPLMYTAGRKFDIPSLLAECSEWKWTTYKRSQHSSVTFEFTWA